MSLKRLRGAFKTFTVGAFDQLAKKIKKSTIRVLPDDVWSRIMPYADSKILLALTSARKTIRDAAVFRDVANGSYSIAPTSERHFVEFAYFQELFTSSPRSEVWSHQKWEGGGSLRSATLAR